jgi:hypothetical protein
MKRNVYITFALIFLSLFVPYAFAQTDKDREAVIAIPETVISELVRDALPIEVTKHETLSGAIWVKSINNLKLGKNKLSFSVNMLGENIEYTGKIAKVPTHLDFGTIDVSFDCDASIRYDKEKGILYVRPRVLEIRGGNEVLLPLLVGLINDEEYPIKAKELKPIITEYGNKSLVINMDISSVYTEHHMLFIEIKPSVVKNSE